MPMTNDLNPALTPAQRQLASSYHRLIDRFMYRHGLSTDAVEDWYGTAAIGLCKAAKNSSCSKTTPFPLLAFLYMENEVDQISMDFEICPSAVSGAIGIVYRALDKNQREIVRKIVNEDIAIPEIARQMGVTSDDIAITYKKFVDDVEYFLW